MKPWKICSILALLVLGYPTFNYFTERIHLNSNTREMKTEILRKIPIGSSISNAQAIFLKDGFECRMFFNDSFSENEGMENISDSRDIDFLYCAKSRSAFICNETWQIAIVQRENSVDDVLVSRGSACL
jgi:hypothetical protein